MWTAGKHSAANSAKGQRKSSKEFCKVFSHGTASSFWKRFISPCLSAMIRAESSYFTILARPQR
jgi:hypothetical protein